MVIDKNQISYKTDSFQIPKIKDKLLDTSF